MPSVFISYSHLNEDWKKRVHGHLAVLAHQGLLTVWEDRQIAAGDDWLPEIEKAIETAQVAVLLISREFLNSNFILGKEIPELLKRRKEAGLRIIPLIVRPCAWQKVDWLQSIQGRPKDNQPLSGFSEHEQETHLCNLALEIDELLKVVPPPPAAEPEKTDIPPSAARPDYDPRNAAFIVPFRAKGKYLVGRAAALEKVRQQLLAGRPTSIGQTALFQGIGGLGKTQLAVEYAHQYRNDYPNGVYWITADENIDAQLTRIAVAARWIAPESEHAIKLAVARQRLKIYSDCLIVFDNLETVDAIRDYLPEPTATPHILVTSRSEQPNFTDVKLDLLDAAQSSELLRQEADAEPKDADDEAALHDIVTLLNGLPLALELAGAYLKHRPIGWRAYRDLLQTDLRGALPTRFDSMTQHQADLFKTLTISEREIGEQPLLAEVLDVLTWSGAAPMGLALLAHLLDRPATQLYGALGLGVALRLLLQTADGERYAVHRLVQEVRRQENPRIERQAWAVTIARRLGDWFEQIHDDFHKLPAYEAEFEHLRAWQAHVGPVSPSDAVRLLWLQAYPEYYRGRYRAARDIVAGALANYDAAGLGNSNLKAHLLSDLGSCEYSLGDYSGARELAQQALEMRYELLGNKHPDIARSLGNLAATHATLGNFPRALELEQQGLDMRKEVLGNKHPDVALALQNLAGYYSTQRNNTRAMELGQQALEMRKELLGDKHPSIAWSLYSLADYHAMRGNYRRAIDLGQRSLDMRKELLGDKHPDVASSLNNLAAHHANLGNMPLALDLGQQALTMRRELLGCTHPDTLASLKNVVYLLFKNPLNVRHGKALLEEYLKQIPQDHPMRAELLALAPKFGGFRPAGAGKSGKRKKK